MPPRSPPPSATSFPADLARKDCSSSTAGAHPSKSWRSQMSKSVAIVTGASQGIGRATAIRLARDFSALVLIARNQVKLAQTAEAVSTAGAQALVIDADLAQPQAAQ